MYKGYLTSAVGKDIVAVKTLKGTNKSFTIYIPVYNYGLWSSLSYVAIIVNPQRACAVRVIVVILYVCLFVCLSVCLSVCL